MHLAKIIIISMRIALLQWYFGLARFLLIKITLIENI